MQASKIEFYVGETRFHQPVQLIRERGTDGKVGWTIRRLEGCQRDDTQTIAGLSDDVILAMADLVKQTKANPL